MIESRVERRERARSRAAIARYSTVAGANVTSPTGSGQVTQERCLCAGIHRHESDGFRGGPNHRHLGAAHTVRACEFGGPAASQAPRTLGRNSLCAEPPPGMLSQLPLSTLSARLFSWRIGGRRFDLDMDECFRASSGDLVVSHTAKPSKPQGCRSRPPITQPRSSRARPAGGS